MWVHVECNYDGAASGDGDLVMMYSSQQLSCFSCLVTQSMLLGFLVYSFSSG